MIRHAKVLSTVCALALAAAAPAIAQNQPAGQTEGVDQAMLQQLADQAGVTVEQASQMTLNQLAALKYNRDTYEGDAANIPVYDPANPMIGDAALEQLAENAGITIEQARAMSLDELGAMVFNNASRSDAEEIPVGAPESGTMDPATLAQMASQAGISQEEASRMTLNELSAMIFNRTRGDANEIPVDGDNDDASVQD